MPTVIPQGYESALGLYETQKAIGLIKQIFLAKLCSALHLKRVTAPLFVDPALGLNDDLNGVERPVAFDIPAVCGTAQVVHSLAKWKRLALHEYDFFPGNGLVTDMNAIRRDEALDNLHSVYVDQWDWEKVILREDRTQAYLEKTVQDIVHAVCGTLDEVKWQFPQLCVQLERSVTFVTSQQLEDRWPGMTPKQRENAICRECRTVFIGQIGAPLASWADVTLLTGRDSHTIYGNAIFSRVADTALVDMLYMGVILSDYGRFSTALDESGRMIRDRVFEN